ncbi:hypothetical protein JXQ70_15285, partial [bacterium]|nr:hypothetical protein [bacterium]
MFRPDRALTLLIASPGASPRAGILCPVGVISRYIVSGGRGQKPLLVLKDDSIILMNRITKNRLLVYNYRDRSMIGLRLPVYYR